jgi:hypothetical protein
VLLHRDANPFGRGHRQRSSTNYIMAGRHSKQMQTSFDEAFIAPFGSHKWRSGRSRNHWTDLEGWQDSMAGPISAVAESGNCQYVYSREDAYFAGVKDAETLLDRLMKWHTGLVAGINRFVPASDGEIEDKEYMHKTANTMLELVLQTFEIEKVRLLPKQ